ncbi:MAG TPA: hypothetical protein VF013_08760, partial [Candidatus Limnocylindria bacterium]
ALVGGALIAVAKVLPESNETAEATRTQAPSATVTPSRTPRPRPTPTPFPAAPPQITVQPGEVPDPVEYPPWIAGWLRAIEDVPIYETVSANASEVRVMHAGEAAYVSSYGVDSPPRWFTVEAPQPAGFIRYDATDPRMEFISQATGISSPSIWSLVAGESGFLAFGVGAAPANENQPPLLVASTDGERWTNVHDQFRAEWFGSAVWGPAGWLALTPVDTVNGPRAWVWRSPDGTHWDALGSLEDMTTGYPGPMAAAAGGYLAIIPNASGSHNRAWYTEEGELWEERPVPETANRPDAQPRLVGLPAGFFAWSDGGGYPRSPASAAIAFSPNGWDWTVAEDGPSTTGLQLIQVGTEVRAISIKPGGRRFEAWIGAVDGATIRWSRDPQQATFDGRGVSALASDGERGLAVGWDFASGDAMGWLLEDGDWRQVRIPARTEDVFPAMLAGGEGGFVLVGGDPSLRATNPVAWHSSDGRTWSAVPVPLAPRIGDPQPSECQPIGTMDAVTFATMDRVLALVCLGDTPLTFRAYSARCDGCYGGWPGTFEPGWLANPTQNKLYLSPIESDGYYSEAIVDPSLRVTADWQNVWVEVTGHFDDPAAMDCTWRPSAEANSYYYGGWVGPIVTSCRQQFVVTQVTVVDGP